MDTRLAGGDSRISALPRVVALNATDLFPVVQGSQTSSVAAIQLLNFLLGLGPVGPVNITSGTINGTTIGGTNPAAGTFTSLVVNTSASGAGFTPLFASPPPIGSTAANSGAFTTLSASSTVSGTGFSTYLASPPAIGSTVAGSGAFTTLSATGAVSGLGFTNLFASPPSIGSTSAGSGAFTTLSASSTVSGAGFTTLFASPPSIGSTLAGTGAFTTLSASSTVSGTGFSTYLASPPAIGGTAAAAGTFTTLIGTGGLNSSGTYAGAYTDGTVVDYATGNGRISVGAADTLTFYTGGIATTLMAQLSSTNASFAGSITPSQTGGIVGTTTNNSANAGSVGEFVTATAAFGSVSLTTGTPANITSISLTAGDWDVWGAIVFSPTATTNIQMYQASVNTTSATDGTLALNSNREIVGAIVPGATNFTTVSPCWRLLIAATTTVYLVADAGFSASTLTAGGTINARRRR